MLTNFFRRSILLPALALALLGPAAVAEPGFNEDTFDGLKLRNIGPAFMSGRIADIAIDPRDRSVWYVAVGSGNLWKTANAGTTWDPVFDDQPSYSLGSVAVDPSRPDTVWLGTGENVGGRHVGYGDGVYRSLNGGQDWENMGLKNSEHIGNIIVHPEDSNTVFVAAQGPLWSAGGERGLYKTTDGGRNWKKVLGGGEYTGVNEVHMDPRDPDVLYAATHQRYRTVAALVNGGPESGIHKSTDGGETWREVTTGLPEDEDMGKIGLAVSPIDPDVVYAIVELPHRKGGFYRSTDAGESWEKRSDQASGGTGPHYYQEIFASPHKFDRVYHMNNYLMLTEDGGKTFTNIQRDNKHVDNHAMAFDPNDPDYLLVGTDGGLYESWDLGDHWKYIANLPVTQFYKVAVDYDEPFYNVYGGTQDNNTQGGPSRTDNISGIRNSDWFVTLAGDGHQPAVDPTNPDIVYSQWQQGNFVRYDKKNGEVIYIQPQPGENEPEERFNWDAPILISPHDAATIFVASQRLWRSDDRGDSWTAISGDLTRDIDRLTEPMMGRVQSWDAVWDLYAMGRFSTISSISQSPLDADLIYVGTDDGLVQITEDGGDTWRRIGRLPGVPERAYVNDIKADLHDPDTVYVAVDDHKTGNFSPFILKSTDRGRRWQSITGNLPDRHIVWRVVQDHVKPGLMFAGTEFGVFFTVDSGRVWTRLAGDVPNIPFRDLVIQTRENDLVGATFGRGFYILDDYSPLRDLTEETLTEEAVLFPVREARWYVERQPLGRGAKGSQGEDYYVAPNPPFGAVFTYYLGDEIRNARDERLEREKPVAEDGGDTPYPGWDALREEELEEDPAMVLTVTDSGGEVVRVLTGPVEAGFNRVAWDLRYPSLEPWTAESEQQWWQPIGVLALPGRYSVQMAIRKAGRLTNVGEPQPFDVTSIREATLTDSNLDEAIRFARDVDEMQRTADSAESSVDEALASMKAIRAALDRSTADAALGVEARRLERQLQDIKLRLAGSETLDRMNTSGPVSISRRLFVAGHGKRQSAYGPTATHKASADIARRGLSAVRAELDEVLGKQLPDLQQKLDAAGVPWTPGRR